MQVHLTETEAVGMGSEIASASRISLSIAAAWLMSLGLDVLLHGGLLARLYMVPSRFLFGPEDAFRRIPLGYLAFLLLTAAVYWLLHRLGVRGARRGLPTWSSRWRRDVGRIHRWALLHQHSDAAAPGWLVDRPDGRVGPGRRGARRGAERPTAQVAVFR